MRGAMVEIFRFRTRPNFFEDTKDEDIQKATFLYSGNLMVHYRNKNLITLKILTRDLLSNDLLNETKNSYWTTRRWRLGGPCMIEYHSNGVV